MLKRIICFYILLTGIFIYSSNCWARGNNVHLHEENASLFNKLEELQNQIMQMNGKIEVLEFRYNNLEDKIELLFNSQKSNLESSTDKNNNSDPKNEEGNEFVKEYEILEKIYNERKAESKKSKINLKEYIENNKNSPYINYAYYLLGKIYLEDKNYEDAVMQFLSGYKKFPNHKFASDNLLNLANSLVIMNKKSSACKTLDKFLSQFPLEKEKIQGTRLENLDCS